MYIPSQKFNNRDTLIDMLIEFESASITPEMEALLEPIWAKDLDPEQQNEELADSLLATYSEFEVKSIGSQYLLYGVTNEKLVLLQEFTH